MKVNFKRKRVNLRKWGVSHAELHITHSSDNTDSVLCIEGSRINIFTIWLLFCKLMFGQSNLNFLFFCNRVKTYDCGERIAGWLSTFLGHPCRLIRQSSDMRSKSHQKNTKGMLSYLKIFVIPHAQVRLVDFSLSMYRYPDKGWKSYPV